VRAQLRHGLLLTLLLLAPGLAAAPADADPAALGPAGREGAPDPPAPPSAPPAPLGWPEGRPLPPEVVAAQEALRAAREAARRTRLGLEAEVTLAPELDVLRRDDPPRPATTDLDLRPEATVTWSPLRSETLLARARVLEAEVDLADAWREAILTAWRAPVARARARADLQEARADLDAARAARDAAASEASVAGADRATAEDDPAAGPDAAAAALREARLDVREAHLDLAEARRELAALPTAPGDDPGAPPVRERRVALPPPTPAPGWTPRALRARALRLAADVARSERRRLGALLPKLGVEVGYAGSDAAWRAELALERGRPRGELGASLGGTPQERGWLKAYAALRIGSDARRREAALADARRAERLGREAEAAAWRAELRAVRADAEAREARWRLAEARLASARRGDDGRRVARAEDRARRAWLSYLTAAGKAWTLLERLPPLPPEPARPTR
jgi:hypothetical protein